MASLPIGRYVPVNTFLLKTAGLLGLCADRIRASRGRPDEDPVYDIIINTLTYYKETTSAYGSYYVILIIL